MGVGAAPWSWTPLRSGAAPPAPRGNTTELWPQQKGVSHGALCLWKGLLRACTGPWHLSAWLFPSGRRSLPQSHCPPAAGWAESDPALPHVPRRECPRWSCHSSTVSHHPKSSLSGTKSHCWPPVTKGWQHSKYPPAREYPSADCPTIGEGQEQIWDLHPQARALGGLRHIHVDAASKSHLKQVTWETSCPPDTMGSTKDIPSCFC